MGNFVILFVKKYKRLFAILAAVSIPLIAIGYEAPNPCEPDWKFFGWSYSNCGLDGGSQGVGHSHLPDPKRCVYYFVDVKYFFGFKIETRIRTVEGNCID
ncbi:hypothetical protein [Aquirufa rosea]|uniref:Secreted protein n=1 Tax=Aquirufa rosea TaxID=2509241 RepID=A0A4Q1BX49_9BACT|nr:hypothetical protein [Aquirufa rosea]RXK46772.1 hypothetical protein ESB04_11430 [Aquirufa rosea]